MSLPRAIGAIALGLANFASAQNYPNISSSEDVVTVKWIGNTPTLNSGSTFGLPWPRGLYQANQTTFTGLGGDGNDQVQIESWVTAYWPDDSIKWTGHALGGSEKVYEEYKITASARVETNTTKRANPSTQSGLTVNDSNDEITVNTGKLTAIFPKSGNTLLSTIKTSSGKIVGQNGRLILRSQSGIADDEGNTTSIDKLRFESAIEEVAVDSSKDSTVRTLITVRGKHQTTLGTHDDWLPFILRFYLYANSDAIRVVHTLVFDGKGDKDFVSGIGIQFDVPLAGEELYNRHVRLAGPDGGLLSEAVQGITGLRRDPGKEVRSAQFKGEQTPDIASWDTRVSSRLKWIPSWNDYSLTQLSPDGFTLKKRTKAGQSWVKIPGGTRAGGLAYLGGATQGGLAVALRDFWKKYPTSLDISNAATDVWSDNPMAIQPFCRTHGSQTLP